MTDPVAVERTFREELDNWMAHWHDPNACDALVLDGPQAVALLARTSTGWSCWCSGWPWRMRGGVWAMGPAMYRNSLAVRGPRGRCLVVQRRWMRRSTRRSRS